MGDKSNSGTTGGMGRPGDLASIVARRRRLLSERPDVSARMRELSRSSSQHGMEDTPGRRKIATTLALALGVALLVSCALATTGLVASGVWLQGDLSDPPTTAQNFYGALHRQDYARAYSYLSAAARKNISASAFAAQYSGVDQVAGVVESYTITSATTRGATATIVASVVRRGALTQSQIETLALAKENGAWKIDNVSVGGTAPAPTP